MVERLDEELFIGDDKEGFTRFTEIIFLPCRFFDTVRIMSMLDAKLIGNNFLLLNFQAFNKQTMLGFHADSFNKTEVIKKKPDNEKSKHQPEKILFRVQSDLLPYSVDNLLQVTKRYGWPGSAEVKKRTPV